MHWKALAAFAVAGTSISYATYARVESMGKHDTYFMDDISVWSNPANANIYPNYLFGELGQMRQNGSINTSRALSGGGDTTGSAFARYNKDPQNPWFGAVFAKSFSSDPNSGNRYPQIVIGGALNRDDELLSLLPSRVLLTSPASKTLVPVADSLSETPLKFDALVGFAAPNGMLFGAKLYVAMADTSSEGTTPYESKSSLWAGTFGVNMPLAQGLDFEAALTVAQADVDVTKGEYSYSSNSDLSFIGSARAFISAPAISGEIVPAVKVQQLDGPGIENDLRLTAGSGVNVSMDRGFFWIGADYSMISQELLLDSVKNIVTDVGSTKLTTYDAQEVRVSFGIERNVWWDWFVLRVGGQKVFTSDELVRNGKKTTNITTNPEGDGTENDHVSFGFGLNIEDKLKVDAVVAEDILFTGGNLLGGPADHILSRISATYSF